MVRKDKKKRTLRKGEGQRPDGRYYYKYKDVKGEKHFAYSWKLEPYDIPPVGKTSDLSLRELEKKISRDVDAGIIGYDSKLTVLGLVRLYLQQKVDVRPHTLSNYNYVVNILTDDPFGSMTIGRVKQSDAKRWLIKLQRGGRSCGTIRNIRGIVNPAFQMAVADDLLLKNPFAFKLSTIMVNNSVKRNALSHEDYHKFLAFIANDKHFSRYFDAIYILFNTGLRISEFVGLTIRDINLKDQRLTVDHQLHRTIHMEYLIGATKTEAGSRVIPISRDVCAAFKRIIENRKVPPVEPIIGGKMLFLFLDKNGMPMVAFHWERIFQRICKKYNSTNRVQLPKITPHICRHTYCSNMAHSGINPKVLQYLMGHSDISVTLNTYTHTNLEMVEEELKQVNCSGL